MIKLNQHINTILNLFGGKAVSETTINHFDVYFQEFLYQAPMSSFSFLYPTIPSFIARKQFDKAQDVIARCEALTVPGTYNWAIVCQYKVIYYLHTGELQTAFDIYREAVEHYDIMFENLKEQWRITEAYIYFLIEAGKVVAPESYARKFRLNKFLNQVPVFEKDKRGNNIPILIVQVLFLLLRKKYGQIADRVEALDQYCYRHLRRDETFRSNCFIKMLIETYKANFHPVATRRKAVRYTKALNNNSIETSGQPGEIELIPYERLWGMIIKIIKGEIVVVH